MKVKRIYEKFYYNPDAQNFFLVENVEETKIDSMQNINAPTNV